jgi:opacity protein-like surface antigen
VKKHITLLSFFFLTMLVSFGQFKRQREYSGFFDTYYYRGPITFTLGGGLSNYRGDLTDGISLKGLSYAFSAGANYKLWPHLVFGAELSYVNLKGSDFNETRALTSNANGFEIQAYGRLYFIDEIVRVAPDRRKESHYTFCKPYMHLGIGALMYGATLNSPTKPSTSISGSVAMILPVGLGLQFTVTQRSSLCVEYVYRFTTTDYLDNYNSSSAKNDGYGILQVKFQFAPTAPKKKKKLNLAPPAKYEGVKGTETWKTRKQQEQTNKPRPQEYDIPESNTEEEVIEEEVIDEQVPEEGTIQEEGY